MQTMNISLPDPMKDFVDGQVASGRYSSASEYVRELIRKDEKRRAEEKLEAQLLEGLNSGDRIEILLNTGSESDSSSLSAISSGRAPDSEPLHRPARS